MKREYRLKRRAERQLATRRRITEAAVELHSTVGPAHTSISAIAERAGVQRHTVYAHFPDERSLVGACSALWREQHPFPELDRPLAQERPAERLADVLQALYAWYEGVEEELALYIRDAWAMPAVAELREADARRRAQLRDALMGGWGARGHRRSRLRAAIGHALEFETWRSLVRRHGLCRHEAVAAMVRLVETI